MGRAKAMVELAGVPLWRHVHSTLAAFVHEVICVGTVSGFDPSPLRLLADDPTDSGPLGGILSALEKSRFRHHLVVAVDYPLVRSAWLDMLLSQSEGVSAVCGRSAGFLEPLVGYYHAECAPVIQAMLARGDGRAHGLFELVASRVISDEEYNSVDPARWSQFNVNTPDNLARAEVMLKEGYPR